VAKAASLRASEDLIRQRLEATAANAEEQAALAAD
jgi:hypothetical protein